MSWSAVTKWASMGAMACFLMACSGVGQVAVSEPETGAGENSKPLQSDASSMQEQQEHLKEQCDAKPLQSLLGEPYDDALLQKIKQQSGAREARILHIDSVVTKEYKFDRVNVVVDAEDRVAGIYCG